MIILIETMIIPINVTFHNIIIFFGIQFLLNEFLF